jgi:hypothetical protein
MCITCPTRAGGGAAFVIVAAQPEATAAITPLSKRARRLREAIDMGVTIYDL